jgi:hypothetical protein
MDKKIHEVKERKPGMAGAYQDAIDAIDKEFPDNQWDRESIEALAASERRNTIYFFFVVILIIIVIFINMPDAPWSLTLLVQSWLR